MRYTGLQPQYFPRLHYFARILNTDIFVIRDDVQFVRKHKYPDGKTDKSYQADTPIKQSTGVQLLSVPVKHVGEYTSIAKTAISYDADWVGSHLKTVGFVFAKLTNFSTLFSSLTQLLQSKYQRLSDLTSATIFWGILILLGENVTPQKLTLDYINLLLKKQRRFRLKQIQMATETEVVKQFTTESANEKILALIKSIGANEDYCGGTAVAAYLDKGIFARNGITINVQNWRCQQYPQLFMRQQGFIPNLSIIDLLMNVSAMEAAAILKG